MNSRRSKTILGRILVWSVILLTAFAAFFYGLRNVTGKLSEQGKTKLEEAVRRGAVACYAAEGAYPPSIEYLEEHYGLTVDESRYIVHYEVFADNILPDITVLDNLG